jgi:uncharacterized membrane protein
VFAPSWLHGTIRAVAAYDAFALVLLCINWTYNLRDDAKHTIRRAAENDPGKNIVFALVMVAVIFGLVSAISILGHGPNVPKIDRYMALGLGLAAVVLGWVLIHTLFVFRYAHLYYHDDDGDGQGERGLTFPGTPEPDDYDFAYFSFVVGMTFQVSDVQVCSSDMRRSVLLHGLISFAYSVAIIALGVNLVSNIVNNPGN